MIQNTNTSSIETQRNLRIQKLEKLRNLGIDPFPADSKRDYTLKQVKENFEELTKQNIPPVEVSNSKSLGMFESENLPAAPLATVTLAGRLKSKRGSGKISFATVEDESLPEGFQFVFKKDELPQANYDKLTENNPTDSQKYLSLDQKLTFKAFESLLDEGDYIQATGNLDVTIAGEPSLFVLEFVILTKSLRPLPVSIEYQNVEARYLDRVADYKLNTKDENGLSVRDVVKIKSKYWSIWREEMVTRGFLEVETPTLQLIPGGAEAKTFNTFYNDLNSEVVLRISPELSLKKLQAGGFEKIFEIGRNFRNEGSSPQHLQEYTAIEWYCAYENYEYGMKLTKKIYQRIVKEVLGETQQIDYYGNTINWGEWCTEQEATKNGWGLVDGWPKIKYFEAVRYFSNGEIDTENKTVNELVEMCHNQRIQEVKPEDGIATLLDKLWKKARVNTTNPFFLVLPPVELEPLAKRNSSNPKLTERYQLVAGRAELGKGFSELNDPIDQHTRFTEQQTAREAGNDEAQAMDESYVKAMEYGMPPMSGFGTSERFVSFLLGKHIKECVTFPHIRAEDKENNSKSKSTIVNHILVLENLKNWQKANAYSHLSASFGARTGKSLFNFEHLDSSDGQKINMNIGSAILNKIAVDSESLKQLKMAAEKSKLDVEIFTEDMQETTDDNRIKEIYAGKNYEDIKLLGILISGKKSEVEKLTRDFPLFD